MLYPFPQILIFVKTKCYEMSIKNVKHMKKIITSLIYLTFGIFILNNLNAQCTPGDSLTCPDPENNGQICPATLAEANTNQAYEQEFTILPPPEYILDTVNGIVIELHHIKIKDIGNLPSGISWQSNADDSVFMVGTYSCVLLSGTPTVAGHYPLKIEVDIYVPGILGSPPILVGTITDSTSLAIDVNPTGITEFGTNSFILMDSRPNPFSTNLDLTYFVTEPGTIFFQFFNVLGGLIHQETIQAQFGENHIHFDGSGLKPGVYMYSISDKRQSMTQRVIKSR